MQIADKELGDDKPCLIIAEMGLGHDGSLGAACAFIDAVSEAGADAVKFQTHLASAEGTKAEKFRADVFIQDRTRQDYWARTAFSEDEWTILRKRADEKGIIFLSSPFSIEAAELLERIGVAAWKVPSGETSNLMLLERLSVTGIPVLLSSGMSYYEELDKAVSLLKSKQTELAVFQCTNRYPCPAEHIGLNVIAEYRERYNVPIGFSDHSGRICTGIAAYGMGARLLEVHVTFHRKCFGPDVSSSLTLEELEELIRSVRYLERAYLNPVKKNKEADSLASTRELFTKSVVPSKPIMAGSRISLEQLAFKKPGTGIPAIKYQEVLGKRTLRELQTDELFSWDDLADD